MSYARVDAKGMSGRRLTFIRHLMCIWVGWTTNRPYSRNRLRWRSSLIGSEPKRRMFSSKVNFPPTLETCLARRPNIASIDSHVSVLSSQPSESYSPSESETSSSRKSMNDKDTVRSFPEVIDDKRFRKDRGSLLVPRRSA